MTKITTTKREVNQKLIEDKAISFKLEFNEKVVPRFFSDQICNTDQSGFNYLHFGHRTLSVVGEEDMYLFDGRSELYHSFLIGIIAFNLKSLRKI